MVSISRRWLILLGSRPCPQVFLFSIEYLFEIFILSCSSQYLLTICSIKIGMYILAAIYHLPLPWRLMHLSSLRLIPLISNPLSRILLIGDILFPALSVILFLTYINMLKTYFFKRKNGNRVYSNLRQPYPLPRWLFSLLCPLLHQHLQRRVGVSCPPNSPTYSPSPKFLEPTLTNF